MVMVVNMNLYEAIELLDVASNTSLLAFFAAKNASVFK
jgi:hypothetical protein